MGSYTTMDKNTRRSRIHTQGSRNKDIQNDNGTDIPKVITTSGNASVEIFTSMCFQKFRYKDEHRPGTKNQDQNFISLKLHHLKDRVVRVVIVCTDAVNHELIHPNGLAGVDCHYGIYDNKYAITKESVDIKIPFLRILRMKTKKDEYKKIHTIMRERTSHLPSPYKERCQSQCSEMTETSLFDFNKVCLGVIVTDDKNVGNVNGTLHAISPVIMNASQKTKLEIFKLSTIHVPALTGDCINIFTTEDSPKIEPDNYQVYVTYDSDMHELHWESDKYSLTDEDLLYKKVITYHVPRFEPKPDLKSPVAAILHLTCPQSELHCTFTFYYVPKTGQISTKKTYREVKHSCIAQDIMFPSKRMRTEALYNDGSSDDINESLKTKVESLNNNQHVLGTISAESQNDSQEDGELSYLNEHIQNQADFHEHDFQNHHQDSLSREISCQLNTIASKCLNSSNEAITNFYDKNQHIFSDQENHLSGTLQESNVFNGVETCSQNFNVAAPEATFSGHGNILWICSTDETVTGKMDACTM